MSKQLSISQTGLSRKVTIKSEGIGVSCDGCAAYPLFVAAAMRCGTMDQTRQMFGHAREQCQDMRATGHCQKGPGKER